MAEFQKALTLAETRVFERLILDKNAWGDWSWKIDPDNAGVDEQAWVYLNGEYLGEHSLESEFIIGDEITVEDLWDRPFSLELKPGQVRAGENELYVRVHNSAHGAGIHQPVVLEFFKAPGSFSLREDFIGVENKTLVEGETFETHRSKDFGAWSVPRGAVTCEIPAGETGSANATLSPVGSSLRFDLKEPARGIFEVTFNLRQLEGSSEMDTFRVFLYDQRGEAYELGLSTIGPHYGQGGLSGFALFNPENSARIGTHGEHLRTDTDPQRIRLVLESTKGVSFYYGDASDPMIRFPGPPQIGAVVAMELRAGRRGITWQVSNLDLQIEE